MRNLRNWKKWIIYVIPFIIVVILVIMFWPSSKALTTVPNNLTLTYEEEYTSLGYDAPIRIRKAKYTTDNNISKYVYVYCMEGGKGLIYPGSSMKLVTDDEYITEDGIIDDAGIQYIVANGFWGDASLEMSTEDKINYGATQLAIWLYYYDTEENHTNNVRIASLAVEIRTTNKTITNTEHLSILEKAEELCTGAKNAKANGLVNPELTLNDVDTNLKISSDNNYIESDYVIVVLKGLTSYNAVVVNDDFTIIGDDGNPKTSFASGEKIKIRANKSEVTSNLNVTLKITARGKKYLPYLYDPGAAICPDNSTVCTPGETLYYKQRVVYTPSSEEVLLEKDINFVYELANKKVTISKQDATTGKELPGAKLKLVDERGNLVEEWTSTETPHEIELEPGKYSLTETIAPNGYTLSLETVTFTVNSDGTTEPKNIVMQNKYIEVPITDLDTPQILIIAFSIFAVLGVGLLYVANKKQKNI